eukprot:TRINITY_DN68_c0_g1_i1.p1 TRINITY_DN68_c0_g1~~TRINITY_DN68_c0_g1_i1.p1  ORF type:complete len:349 (+),score=164.32 TRINITY_DN68_c0_g1_i1:94-1140(+)
MSLTDLTREQLLEYLENHKGPSGFGYRNTAQDVVSDLDFTNKTAIVTGASSGLGIEICRALAGKNCRVFVGARNAEKANEVIEELKQSTGNDNIELLQVDLNSLSSVRAATDAFLARNIPVHMLINNAGVMAIAEKSFTEDGFEKQFGINHLGHFCFTNRLYPALEQASKEEGMAGKVRVVNVSSCAHLYGGIDFDDINFENREYEKWISYAQSKTANISFAVGLNKRLVKNNIGEAFAIHPGGILTGLQKEMSYEEKLARGWIDEEGNVNPMFKSVEEGASTATFAATSSYLEGKGGYYLEDNNLSNIVEGPVGKMMVGLRQYAIDEENAEKLWKISEEMINETFDF